MDKYKVYKIESDKIVQLNYGAFFSYVKDGLNEEYGSSSKIIEKNVEKIYRKILNLDEKRKNLLLVGKVQSGKTSNLELLTGLMFDNGYNLCVLFGGYDNTLLSQTLDRFKNTFHEFVTKEDAEIIINSSLNTKFADSTKRQILFNQLENGKKIIFITIKKPQIINDIAELLKYLRTDKIKPFIIDDEGDQASLNTEFKKDKESPTYNAIVNLKTALNNPVYLSSTATPHAIVFQPVFSEINPSDVSLINPGLGYYGTDEFHLDDKKIVYVKDEGIKSFTDEMENALRHFLIASAIRYIQNPSNMTDMIIHVAKEVNVHKKIYLQIQTKIRLYKDTFYNYPNNFTDYFKDIYNNLFFDEEVINKYNINNIVKIIGENILSEVHIIEHNSKGADTQEWAKYSKYKIYIGGDLLQRGVTFRNLVTTFFTRWTKTPGNIDTTLQRARWFGYRTSVYSLMKIFTSEEIATTFSKLSDIDNDLWSQFSDCELNLTTIDEIFVDLTETNMRITRTNVVDTIETKYSRKWVKQRRGIFNEFELNSNNSAIKDFLISFDFTRVSLGRTDGQKNVSVAEVSARDIKTLINKMSTDIKNNKLSEILLTLENNVKIDFIKMYNEDSEARIRTFNRENEINNLHQGMDTTNLERSKYSGDATVLRDYEKVTIQLFDVIPKIYTTIEEKYRQYMFALYTPKKGRMVRRK